MPNPAIVPAPPGLGGPPAAPVAAAPPPPPPPPPPPQPADDAPAGAAQLALAGPVHHDMASSNGSAMSQAQRLFHADAATQLEALEGRLQAVEDAVQELTGLVMDLQTSLATVLENNLRGGRRSPPPPSS